MSRRLMEAVAKTASANAALDVAQASYGAALRFLVEVVDEEETREKIFQIERLLTSVGVHVRGLRGRS